MKKRRRKKQTLTLLEVIIALALTAILLSVLLGSAFQLFALRHKLEAVKQEVSAKRWIHQRLSLLFSSLESTEGDMFTAPPTEGPLESKSGKDLVMWLDHIVDPDPNFSGKIRAYLAIEADEDDRKKQILTLTLHGRGNNRRKEVLLSEIEKISFSFLDLGFSPHEEKQLWHDRTGELPVYIRVTIHSSLFKREKEEFAFFLPSNYNRLHYYPNATTERRELR